MTIEQQQEEQTKVDVSAELAAGFNDEQSQAPQQEAQQDQQTEQANPEVKQEAPEQTAQEQQAPEEAKPETVTITAEQWQALQNKLSEIENFKQDASRRIDQSLGRYGELNRTIQQMQQQPKGGIALSKDKFKRLSNDFPELATLLAEDLSEALGAAPAAPEQKAPPATIDPEELQRKFDERLNEKLQELALNNEKRQLMRRHKDWEQVVQSADFNQWGSTLPQAEWESIRSSMDADTVASAIDRFKQAKSEAEAAAKAAATKATKQQSASKRLEAAITPTGTAGSVPQLTERDLFLQGFRSP